MSLAIGFAYDPPNAPESDLVSSVAAEYEDEPSIEWLRACLSSRGRVVDLPWSSDFPSRLRSSGCDVVFNITEASGGRNRESYVPAATEAIGIPCTGSDALALGVCLDKQLAKSVARACGIPVAPGVLLRHMSEVESKSAEIDGLTLPLIAKPNTGGSSMGIRAESRITSRADLRQAVEYVLEECGDAALVEEFVAGRELAGGILERHEPGVRPIRETLPVAEIRTGGGRADDFYSFEHKSAHDKQIRFPDGPEGLLEQVTSWSVTLFDAIGCRDLARVDFRVSAADLPVFLEINPLPGLSPYYSIYPKQAERAGLEPEQLVHRLLENARAGGAIRGQQ